jgi:hypothetical protein
MNIRMLHDQLVRTIQKFGSDARESRQVYRRLCDLLPDRVETIARQLRRSSRGTSATLRMAYASAEFQEYVEEVVNMSALSMEARVQYETHLMLVDARRTLRRKSR